MIRVDTRFRRAVEAGAMPKECLIVGPAGTGKTFGVLAVLHAIAKKYPNLRILLLRQTRVSLSESVLVTYEQDVLATDGMGGIAAGASRRNRAGYRYANGTELALGGLDKPGRIFSTSWDIVYINEAVELDEDAWLTVGSRLNRPGRPGCLGWLVGDTNPGDPSHWLKARCDRGETALWESLHESNPAMHDGRGWTEAGRLYLEQLDRLRGTLHKRLKLGLWAAGSGQWFDSFGEAHVTERADFDRSWPVHLAVDSGVHTGAVWFQVKGDAGNESVNVFGDYYAFNRPAFDVAGEIIARTRGLCTRSDRGTTDPAGGANNPVGPTVTGEYQRAGLKLEPWPVRSVADGLALVNSFVAVDPPALTVHPRCRHLIEAFANYKRAKRSGQYVDRPEDEQHPYEDLLDPLRGGLQSRFPEGRRPAPKFRYVHQRLLV
jgi:phage terminase large subunit